MKLFAGIYAWVDLLDDDGTPISNNDLLVFTVDEMEGLGMEKDSDDSCIYGINNVNEALQNLSVGEELKLEEPFNGPFIFVRFDGDSEMLTKFRLKWLTKWYSQMIVDKNETIERLKDEIKSYSYKQLTKEELKEKDDSTPNMVDWTEFATRDEMLSHLALKDTEEIRDILCSCV